MKRVFLIVLDSVGIGEMPDAADYKVSSGKMKIEMPPLSATILVAT